VAFARAVLRRAHLCLLFGLALAARADGPELELPPVEVRAEPPTRAPAAQSTVVEMAQFAGEARSVAEMLATSPGVSIHAMGGPGQQASVSLRGASAEESLLLLDGIPLRGPGGGSVDLATLPASLLEKLVVSRGVLGAQLGGGALGGAVELIPRAPGQERPRGDAQIEAGSFGTGRLSADVEAPLGYGAGVTAAVQLDTTRGDYPFTRQYTPELPGAPWYDDVRANADARRAAGLLRAASRLGPSSELDFLLQASGGARGLPGPIGAFTPNARMSDAGGLAGIRLRADAGGASWTLRGWGRHDRIDLHGVRAFGDCIEGEPGCDPTRERSTSAAGEIELGLPLGPAQWAKASFASGGEWLAGTDTGSHRRAQRTLALADDVGLASSGVSIHPAVRIDLVGSLWGWSPGAGVAWKLAALDPAGCRAAARWFCGLELRAGAGRSFRAPSFAELYLDQGAVSPNPDLSPERAWSVDAGAAWRGEQLTLSAGGFWSSYQELILYEQFPPARVKAFNAGAACISGVEAQAAAMLPYGFVAEASYSYLHARNCRDSATQGGQPLPYRPPHRLFLRLARRGDRLEGYAELNATSSVARNSFGTSWQPAQMVVNAGAGARVWRGIWLDLDVKNVLDDRTLQDLFQYPLPGISVSAIARIQL